VSSDKRHVVSAVQPGSGWALDPGGGDGELAAALSSRGYRYVNLDLRPADISLARELLGYDPKVAIEEGVRRAVEWFAGRVSSEG
jgi:nucleoside-diphosphate-sugar epimerase